LFLDAADRLFGESGDDLISGDRGNDLLDGGANNDNLNGEDGSDILIGGAGNDQINGGFGDLGSVDVASYATATAAVTVSLEKQFLNQNTFGAGVDYLRCVEGLIGSNFADTLIGDSGRNTVALIQVQADPNPVGAGLPDLAPSPWLLDRQAWSTLIDGTLLLLISYITNCGDDNRLQFCDLCSSA
jgi:Ca2+-binding RTX toxin-like protein